MFETYIFTFNDAASYRKYKKEVTDNGGTIKNDLGETLLGFTALITPNFVNLVRSGNLVSNGITSFEPDGVVTTQAQ